MDRSRNISKGAESRKSESTARTTQGSSPNKRHEATSKLTTSSEKRAGTSSPVRGAGVKISTDRSSSFSCGAKAKHQPFFVTADGLVLGDKNWTKIREGYPISALELLSEHIDMSPAGILETIGVSKSTALRRTGQTHLKRQESEKVYQVAKVVALADHVFGDLNKSHRWLHTPNRALDGDTPFSRLDTAAGADEVAQLLQRIDYGVYS